MKRRRLITKKHQDNCNRSRQCWKWPWLYKQY